MKLFFSFLFSCSIFLSNTIHALPFSVSPASGVPFPTSMVSGTTVYATYTVQNNTQITRYNNYVKYLPPNTTIMSSGCGSSTFTLAPYGQAGDSCSLQLAITGAISSNDGDPRQHLFICFPGGITCAGTESPLNISVLSSIGSTGINALAHLDTAIFAGGLNTSNRGSMWAYTTAWITLFTGSSSSPVNAIYASEDDELIYFGGEVQNSGTFYSAWVYQYDTNEKTATDTGFMSSTSATKLNSLSANGTTTIYAGGVGSTSVQGQVWLYDTTNNVWTSSAIADTNIIEVLAVLYSDVKALLYDAVINNGASTTSQTQYAQVQSYNGTSWTDTGLPTSDSSLYLVTVNAIAVDDVGTLYAGGIDSNQNAAVWKYTGSTWTQLSAPSTLTNGQIYSLAFNSNNVLFAGGFDGSIGQVWYYNSSTNAWVSMNLAGSSLVQTITIDTNNLLYAGGLASGSSSGLWSFSADIE